MRNTITRTAAALLSLALSLPLLANEPLWTHTLDAKVEWSTVTTAGTLLVNSGTTITHLDPDSGAVLWSKTTDKKLAPYNFHDLEGSGYLLIAEQFANIPPKTRLSMYDLLSGDTIWESPELAAGNLAVIPDLERGQLLFIGAFTGTREQQETGNLLQAYDIGTGALRYQTSLAKLNAFPMHLTDSAGWFAPTTDLSGHARPLIDGNRLYLSYNGLMAVNLDDGSILWNQEFDTVDPGLKQSMSPLQLVGDTIYMSARGRVVAIDRNSGAQQWEAKVKKNWAMPELQVLDDQVLVRVGGLFSNGKDLVPREPYGILSLDRASGAEKWEWTKAKDSITNMVVLPEARQVVVADKASLYRLSLDSGKKVDILEKRDLEFKRSMGAVDAVATGGKVVSGLLSGGLVGGLQGGLRGAMSDDRSDPPTSITQLGSNLIVSGNYHVLSWDALNSSDNWSISFAVPGVNPMMLALSGATMALTAMGNAGMHSDWSTRNAKLDSSLNSADKMGAIMSRRFAAAEQAGNLGFFLTKAGEELPGASLQLLGIDYDSGESIGVVPIEEKEPVFTVDNLGRRVYYFHKEKEVRAFGF